MYFSQLSNKPTICSLGNPHKFYTHYCLFLALNSDSGLFEHFANPRAENHNVVPLCPSLALYFLQRAAKFPTAFVLHEIHP